MWFRIGGHSYSSHWSGYWDGLLLSAQDAGAEESATHVFTFLPSSVLVFNELWKLGKSARFIHPCRQCWHFQKVKIPGLVLTSPAVLVLDRYLNRSSFLSSLAWAILPLYLPFPTFSLHRGTPDWRQVWQPLVLRLSTLHPATQMPGLAFTITWWKLHPRLCRTQYKGSFTLQRTDQGTRDRFLPHKVIGTLGFSAFFFIWFNGCLAIFFKAFLPSASRQGVWQNCIRWYKLPAS